MEFRKGGGGFLILVNKFKNLYGIMEKLSFTHKTELDSSVRKVAGFARGRMYEKTVRKMHFCIRSFLFSAQKNSK